MTPLPAPPRAVLDSSVIFSRVLHELFGRLALQARLFDLAWSDELLAEARRVLIERKPTTEAVAERWVGYLSDAFPDGRTDIARLPTGANLAALTSDPEDEHVCALALCAQASLLVTFDTGFNAAGLASYGVRVVTPDEVLVPALDDQPALFVAILERQASAWRGRPLDELIDAFQRAGADAFADRARAAIRA